MPKLQVYDPTPREEEKITRVKLLDYGYGIVTVIAVDKDGYEVAAGNLFQLLPNGKIQRVRCVNPDLGFMLDDEGRIKFEDKDV